MNAKEFQHPPIYIGLMKLYKQYYQKHQHLPKLFRISTGEKMMEEITESMKIVVIANFYKKDKEKIHFIKELLMQLRGKIELLKAYVLLGWEMKFFSDGFTNDLMERLEEISKQCYAWQVYIEKQYS
ncbi:MAG: hypothetical protein OHK0036_17800 [Bacteroidia bacterium]